jgi:hypothetical protein
VVLAMVLLVMEPALARMNVAVFMDTVGLAISIAL